MKKELRRSGAQMNYAQRNYMQGSHHKEAYSRQRSQQYQELSSGYYMYTANAVAREYQYEEEQRPVQKVKKTKVKRSPVLAQHISTVFIVFLLGLALVGQYTIVQSLGYQVSQSKTELKTVQEQNEKIKKQIAAMGELQNVEAVAINNMGMHKPNEWEIIYLPQQTAPTANAEETDAAETAGTVQEMLGTIIH